MFACVMIRAERSAPQAYATPQQLLAALTPFDQADVCGHWENDPMLMVQALTWNTPQSRHEDAPTVCPTTARVLIGWQRLDNRAVLCADLGLADTATLTDPQIILAAHGTWGADCADRLEGDFSFVLYDPASHQAFCARDSIGARPFYYYLDDQVFIAASTAAVFRTLQGLPIRPSRAWMARYMANAPHDMTTSAFDGVSRLAPGHSLCVLRENTPTPQEYFRFQDISPVANHRDPVHVETYREAFHQATQARLRSDFAIGAESSGGLDSSSIVAHTVQHLPHDIDDFHCFGLCIFDDEPDYLLQTALQCGVRHNHISTHTQLHEDARASARVMRVLGHPAEHDQAQLHTPHLRLCAQFGIRTLLSGYGGDEMVTHPAGTLQAELFHNRQYRALAQEMRGNALTRRLRLLKTLRRLSRPVPAATPPHIKGLLANALLQPSVLAQADLEASFMDGLNHRNAATSLSEQMLRDPAFAPRRVARLEACALLAQSYRVDYRWPLFDRALMQQFLRTPAIEKRHKSMGRYLHRRAVAGSIPDAITWKQSKDMGAISTLESLALPKLLVAEDAPPELASLLDFDTLRKTQAICEKNQTNNIISGASIQQFQALWRATLLARWLQE